MERGIGIFGFAVLAIFLIGFSVFVPKKLRFFRFGGRCGLRIFRNINGFSDLIFDAVFGFSYLTHFGFRFLCDLSGNYAPPLISNSS